MGLNNYLEVDTAVFKRRQNHLLYLTSGCSGQPVARPAAEPGLSVSGQTMKDDILKKISPDEALNILQNLSKSDDVLIERSFWLTRRWLSRRWHEIGLDLPF
jgi:hypothetical protein